MIQYEINKVRLGFRKGDISKQANMTAVVNAANAELRTGGGVAGALHTAAGLGLEEECRPLAPISPGEAVITGAHKLPNDYVIHCLGPVYGVDHPKEKLLANCYSNALQLAERKGIDSIAFPSISTGAFGYPIEEAVPIAIDTIMDNIAGLKSVKKIVIVLYSDEDLEAYERYFKQSIRS